MKKRQREKLEKNRLIKLRRACKALCAVSQTYALAEAIRNAHAKPGLFSKGGYVSGGPEQIKPSGSEIVLPKTPIALKLQVFDIASEAIRQFAEKIKPVIEIIRARHRSLE